MRVRFLPAVFLLASSFAFCSPPEPTLPPPTPSGRVIVLGPTLTIPPAAPGALPIPCAPGRFVPLMAEDGSPSYIAPNESFRVYRLKPGSAFTGIKYDAAADAEPEAYSWPDVKSTVYIVLARNRPGKHTIQMLKNGPADVGPVENGAPIIVQIGPPTPLPPDPGPGPKPPDPKPPDPTPVVVKSFRVILVYESGDTLTAAQTSVLYGKAVEDWLNANCTGGKLGWRRRDKDASSVNDPPMSVVWAAVKAEFAPPKNTKVPAVVIQVNEKITIEPLGATPAEMVAVLRKYSEGK